MANATGVCYTQSGNVKRYEDKIYISLVKGTHDIPDIENNIISVNDTNNYNNYKFSYSYSYVFSSKGTSKEDNCPLIFVTYYPSLNKNPCYFNFNYNMHKITFFLYFLTPHTVGSSIFNKISFRKNGISENYDLNNCKYEINVTDSDEIIFLQSDYKSDYNIKKKLDKNNYFVNKYGFSDNSVLSYYNTIRDYSDHFVLCSKINDVIYTDYTNDIKFNNVTEDITAYMYVVPRYIYVHPMHCGNPNDFVWNDEDSTYNQYKMSCSGRSDNTGGNYDRGPWGAPNSDGGNRTNFLSVVYPIGCVKTSDTKDNSEDYYNYHLGVRLTTSLFEYSDYSVHDYYKITKDNYINNPSYFAYNDVCDIYLETLNNSPKPSVSYWGDEYNGPRYIEPYISYIVTNNSARRGNLGITYAKQFPQNNTYIALDRTNPTNSDREPSTTMPPQFWTPQKISYWGKFVGANKINDILLGGIVSYYYPSMILQGLICGGSGNDRNHEALGLFSAISLKGKNKNPDKLMFFAESYNTYFDPSVGNHSGRYYISQPYNSYIITGRIKTGGRSSCEIPIWEKFRFNLTNNIKTWIEEYG